MSSSSANASTPPNTLVVRGERILLATGERPAALHIRDGLITKISSITDVPAGSTVYEAGDSVVMPGLVDTHVHINEPGRTEWEGFATATRAAAAGGITTLIEMPLNSIPATIGVPEFQAKLAAMSGKLYVDTGFWGGIVPGNAKNLAPLWEAGCFGFKCFLVDSGVSEFPAVTEKDLRQCLPILTSLGAPLLVHAELPGPIAAAAEQVSTAGSSRSYQTWLTSRPRASENEAVQLLVRLAVEFQTHIHIVHLSSTDELPLLRTTKSVGTKITAETCPHYLTFASEEIPDGATQFKCAPPIRERLNRETLWAALSDGTLDLIATDHSPCPPARKRLDTGDFLHAWGGIASLQLSLPIVWTQARARGFSVTNLVRWLCAAPARLAGLEKKKGSLEVGCDADLVVWRPDESFRVDPAQLEHRHKITPYAGQELHGKVVATFLRGRQVYHGGQFSSPPSGRVLLRGQQ